MRKRLIAAAIYLLIVCLPVPGAHAQTTGSFRVDNCDGQFNNQIQTCALNLSSLIQSISNFSGFTSADVQFTISGNSSPVSANYTPTFGPYVSSIQTGSINPQTGGIEEYEFFYANVTVNYFVYPNSSASVTVGGTSNSGQAPYYINYTMTSYNETDGGSGGIPSLVGGEQVCNMPSAYAIAFGNYYEPGYGNSFTCANSEISAINCSNPGTPIAGCYPIYEQWNETLASGDTGIYTVDVHLDGPALAALNASGNLPFSINYTNSNYTQFATLNYTYTQPAGSGSSTDGPIPLWTLGALGAGLVGIASRRLKKAA